MMDDDTKKDVMHQLAAVQAALGKAGEVVLKSAVLKSAVQTCVTNAIRSGDERECARKVDELVAMFRRFKRVQEA